LKNAEIENDRRLREAVRDGSKMSKKRRMRIDKIRADQSLSAHEKEALIAQLTNSEEVTKRVKRSQLEDFKDSKNFLTTDKSKADTLWGEEERQFLEEVTVNLLPDDEAPVKGKTVMRWDSSKKRHVLVQVDRDGRIIKDKRNEAGAKISNKDADQGD